MTDAHVHETGDGLDVGRVARWGAVLLGVFLVVSLLACWALVEWLSPGLLERHSLRNRHDRAALPRELPAPGFGAVLAPELQASPRDDLAWLHQRSRRELASWRWTDRSSGLVQVPVERAALLYLEGRGRPTGEVTTGPASLHPPGEGAATAAPHGDHEHGEPAPAGEGGQE